MRFLFALILLAIAWAAGLAFFLAKLPRPADAVPAPADAVVVFTGGADRLESAMALLDQGSGERLLISGVNPEVTRPDIARLWRGDPALFECCVDLGAARSTTGNANEMGDWARKHKFSSLILVTSEYHMPRALLETRERLPEILVTPYPVASGHIGPDGNPETLADWKKLSSEYSKYLAVRAKAIVT